MGSGKWVRPVEDPPFVRWLLSEPWAGLVWLPLRVWLGWQWLSSGLGKVSNPKWMETGEILKGFWMNAVAIPEAGRPPIAFDWYRAFIQALIDAQAWTWFSRVVVIGELMVGVALVLGAFTGIAALVGGFMNWNFMMAGSASVNPVFFVISGGLILAWRVSGYIGADYFLLPWLGTPWSRRATAEREGAVARAGAASEREAAGPSPSRHST